jgi:quinol monooxygenase YgiN
VRCEVVSRLVQPHHLVILEVWKDQTAFEANAKSAHATQARSSIAAIRNAPLDERVHVGVSVGALQPGPGGDAVYVVTHVDVIPPRKDDGLAALKELGDASRASTGNMRFEVVQQMNRPNHFTVVEIWRDAKAVETHSMAEATRRFRDKLGPMSGALYDERMFREVK